VWQFRQIQTPEDGHIGPKNVVLSESEGEKQKKKIVALQTGLIYIDCSISSATKKCLFPLCDIRLSYCE
jgi:hypothetical protein